MSDLRGDVSIATMKASPPVVAMVCGLTLNEWVAVATIVYILLQTLYLGWKWRRERRHPPTGKHS